ncbi:MAG TPA: acyl-CoA synthetase [Solirubrobacteraceae bacterium]|nr:acyl-CoA synthetase [Solirubrobacteraceae bacterium]
MIDDQTAAGSHSLGDLLRRSARRSPDKTAVVDGARRLSFAELDTVVNRTANALAERGVRHGDRVAVLSRNRLEYVVLSFGLARLGALMVPINFMLNGAEVGYVLRHSGAVGLVAEDGLHEVAVAALGHVDAGTVGVLGWLGAAGATPPDGWEHAGAWLEHPDAAAPEVVVADTDPLRLMYTSGTESRPKGAIHSSRSLIAQYVSCIVGGEMTPDDVEVHALPMYHCAQLDCFLGPDIYLGATSIILPAPEPERVLAALEEHRATKFFAPPTVWIGLLRCPAFDATDLTSLRKGYYGASPMPLEVLREMQRRLPDLRLWNFYGQTELAPLATVLGPDEQVSHAGSAGRPVLNVETRVVDDAGRDVPSGEVGEIVHRSPQVTGGYWNDPEKTAEAFQGGWFHSGDLGVMSEDGHLSVVDRKKDMIKTGGENVASREVEEVLYEHPAVAEVAVFALPDPRWVEAVTAAVVVRDGASVAADDLLALCRERLAGFKVPKRLILVDSLPKNPSGKILKRELRERFAAA